MAPEKQVRKPEGFQSVWTRPRTGREQPALSREHIVAEALRLLDEEGIDALSMRKLGARLGSRRDLPLPPCRQQGRAAGAGRRRDLRRDRSPLLPRSGELAYRHGPLRPRAARHDPAPPVAGLRARRVGHVLSRPELDADLRGHAEPADYRRVPGRRGRPGALDARRVRHRHGHQRGRLAQRPRPQRPGRADHGRTAVALPPRRPPRTTRCCARATPNSAARIRGRPGRRGSGTGSTGCSTGWRRG